MSTKKLNVGSLVGGALLIGAGLLSLFGQIFARYNFWDTAWPFILIGVGGLFFAGMFAGGKSSAGLAIPGSIIGLIGVMMFIQNLFDHWESWAYGWTVILIGVGLGIYIMGRYTEDEEQRKSGLRVMKIGAVLFVFFGGFFEMIFNSFGFSRFLFPVALIVLGGYLVMSRSGILTSQSEPSNMSEVVENK